MEIDPILAFFAGIAAAYITLWNAERKITIENITKERAKWREKIREIASQIHNQIIAGDNDKLSELRNQMRLLLNPEDKEDINILRLTCIDDDIDRKNRADEFSLCVSHLLKHDWERAKLESKPIFMRLKFLHENESATTTSEKSFVKLSYVLFFYPKRLSCKN